MRKLFVLLLVVATNAGNLWPNSKINRQKLVQRHTIELSRADTHSPLSVGNGRFCSTVDITGMQTFPEHYRKTIPLTIMSEWGWHSFPNTEGYRVSGTFEYVPSKAGRKVPYPIKGRAGYNYLRANPHQTGLAVIGLYAPEQGELSMEQLKEVHQKLDLWQGLLTSRFSLQGNEVEVMTLCHPEKDALAYKLESALLASGKLGIRIRFPYPSAAHSMDPATYSHADRHTTTLTSTGSNTWEIEHSVDDLTYTCRVSLSAEAELVQLAAHDFLIKPTAGKGKLELLAEFSQGERHGPSEESFSTVRRLCAQSWKEYWKTGGAVDLSGSKDPRWKELERRIVLSQYLTAIQSRQKYPPQETGLTCNSWHGKFHLEMHWWHSVHFALWNREQYLANTLDWYREILPQARAYTEAQGYKGVRWPKMIGPNGIEAPSRIGPLLVWQQPHLLYYCELLYRRYNDAAPLAKYLDLIEATAEFMYDYAVWDAERRQYVLGPPIISAREGNHHTFRNNVNPAFELAYWSWALKKANDWRERLGKQRNPDWDRMADTMSPLPIVGGIYVEAESVLEPDGGHPTQLAVCGFLPESKAVDKSVLKRTLIHTLDHWNWKDTWGWDFPLMAMTATRLHEPELALKALLMDVGKNTYLANGHNYQTSTLPLYLPGNGGLLAAVAMMCAGWDGCETDTPGFPKDGSWVVKWEGLSPVF